MDNVNEAYEEIVVDISKEFGFGQEATAPIKGDTFTGQLWRGEGFHSEADPDMLTMAVTYRHRYHFELFVGYRPDTELILSQCVCGGFDGVQVNEIPSDIIPHPYPIVTGVSSSVAPHGANPKNRALFLMRSAQDNFPNVELSGYIVGGNLPPSIWGEIWYAEGSTQPRIGREEKGESQELGMIIQIPLDEIVSAATASGNAFKERFG